MLKMNETKMLKEKEINNYMANIDFDNINIDTIKEELHHLIGETPAIKINYREDSMIMEDGTSHKKVQVIESVDIIYTYENDNGLPIAATKTVIIN